MAFWIEFRCDWRGAWNSSGPDLNEMCWSHHNAGPGEIADNTSKDVADTRSFLIRYFAKDGFLKIGRNWACPVCAEKIRAGQLPSDPDHIE
jgi:hypothetical protein